MKKMKWLLISLVAALLLALLPAGRVQAAETPSYRVVIEDDADLLTSEEEDRLYQKMLPIASYANVGFHTVREHHYSSTESYAEHYYVQTFGGGVSGTIFIVDMYKRMIYIVSDGAAYQTVTTGRANTITDNIYTYASDGRYYDCAATAFSQILTILEGGRIAEPMKIASNALFALAAAFLLMFLIVQSVTKLQKPSANELLSSSQASFYGDEPRVAHTGTTRRYDPPAKSSGGGGGGHSGGGGGGFSGGGGGHSF